MATRKSAEPAARKKGRPSKFDPKFLRQAFKMSLLGLTEQEMAGVFGVTQQTFNTWKKQHPAFLESIRRGKVDADADVAASLYERARGYSHPEVVITSFQGEITKTKVTRHYPPDTQAASLWLRNRQPKLWRKEQDPTDAPDAPAPVKVEVVVKDARRAEPEPPAG